MKVPIGFTKDRLGAVLIILIGSGVTAQGTTYRMGALTHMGAGFMPVVYGALMVVVGIMLAMTSAPSQSPWARTEWRGWACIIGGVAAFVVLGHFFGFALAAFSSVFISAMGDRSNRTLDAGALALLITVTGYLIFIRCLGMPFPLFTWGA